MNQPLNPKDLDAMLAREDQQRVRETVRLLKEEAPSMAWRSQLNERILAQAGKRRSRQRLWWIFTPSVGVAVAGALAIAVFFHNPSPRSTGNPLPYAATAPSLEDSLIGLAHDNSVSDDVSGSGLHVRDLGSDGKVANDGDDDAEAQSDL
jgi:hypothetical protein